MSVLKEKIRFTYEDYLRLPDDRKRYQIIEGGLFVVPASTPAHQDTLGTLFIILKSFVQRHKLGYVYFAPCDVVLSEEDVVQPDIFFVSKDRTHIVTEKNIRGAPDLIVEILSSFTVKLDKEVKRRLYEKFKVKEYWLVDIEKKEIEVLALKGKSYQSIGVFKGEDSFKSPLLKGLRVNLSDIF